MKALLVLLLASSGYALQFNDEESYVYANELGKKIPEAFAGCGTLIHPNWVLTHKSVGNVEQIIVKGKKYLVDERKIGPSNEEVAPQFKDEHYFFQFQLLHLSQPVKDIAPIASYFYKNGSDFVQKEAQSIVEDGIMGFFVGPAMGTTMENKGCINLDTIDFDQPKIVGSLPIQAIGQSWNGAGKIADISSYKASSGPTKIERYDIQHALYSELFKTNIPVLVKPSQSEAAGAIFVVMGKKSDQISNTDIVMIGINAGKTAEKRSPYIKSLLEGQTQFWIGDTLYPNKIEQVIWPSKVFVDEFAQLVNQKAFVLGVDFSNLTEKFASDINFSSRRMRDFNEFFRGNYKVSHFDISKQAILVRLFDLKAEAPADPLDFVYGFSNTGKYGIENRAPELTSKRYNNSKVSILKIPSFKITNPNNKNEKWYQSDLVDKLLKDAQSGAERLILDLRDNDGGPVKNSKHLLKSLAGADIEGFDVTKEIYNEATNHVESLPKKASDVKKNNLIELAKYLDEKSPIEPETEPLFKGKIIVLINNKTSSAGESTALALNEYLASELVGQQTAGKVLLSTFSPISYGFEGHYPVADYISRKGYRIEGVGVIPTDPIPAYIDPIEYIVSLREIFQKKMHRLKEILSPEHVEIKFSYGGDLTINIEQGVFLPGQAVFEPGFNITKIAEALSVFRGHKIAVNCFASKNETQTSEEREKLSKKRAEFIKKYLIENNAVNTEKISSSGMYYYEMDQEEKNSRRVEITIHNAIKGE